MKNELTKNVLYAIIIFVNLHTLNVSLVACMAAILLTSCSSNSSSNVRPVLPAPSATASAPALGTPLLGYDEWKNWNSGTSSPALQATLKQMGLTVGAFPKQSFVDQGFVGVAQLGTGCIITFATVGVDQPGAHQSNLRRSSATFGSFFYCI